MLSSHEMYVFSLSFFLVFETESSDRRTGTLYKAHRDYCPLSAANEIKFVSVPYDHMHDANRSVHHIIVRKCGSCVAGDQKLLEDLDVLRL